MVFRRPSVWLSPARQEGHGGKVWQGKAAHVLATGTQKEKEEEGEENETFQVTPVSDPLPNRNQLGIHQWPKPPTKIEPPCFNLFPNTVIHQWLNQICVQTLKNSRTEHYFPIENNGKTNN